MDGKSCSCSGASSAPTVNTRSKTDLLLAAAEPQKNSPRQKRFGGHVFHLLGSRDVIGRVTIRLGVGTFVLLINDDYVFILHKYKDTGFKDFGVTSLTFWGHMTSSVT